MQLYILNISMIKGRWLLPFYRDKSNHSLMTCSKSYNQASIKIPDFQTFSALGFNLLFVIDRPELLWGPCFWNSMWWGSPLGPPYLLSPCGRQLVLLSLNKLFPPKREREKRNSMPWIMNVLSSFLGMLFYIFQIPSTGITKKCYIYL